ncbi:MAG: S-adenosylmethionine:tRNA ribosyltransferase-isomerase [Paracoccaceae bacterium]
MHAAHSCSCCTMSTNPQNLDIKAFDYHLPDERIARYPLENRGESALLVYRNGKIGQRVGNGRCQHKAQADGHQKRDHEHLQDLLTLIANQKIDFTLG